MPEIGTYSLSGGRRLAQQRASSDPTDTVQPQGLLGFRNRSASSLLMKMLLLRWNNAKTQGHDPSAASSMMRGAGCRGNPRLPVEGEVFS